MTRTQCSHTLIAEWSDTIAVGIYENGRWSVRLYSDRAIVLSPYVRWVGNTGSYAERHERITGTLHATLIQIAQQQTEDGADYTSRVRALLDRADELTWTD